MNRITRTYYVIYGFYNLSWAFIAPIYMLFLLHRGLDLFQASTVPAVFFIVSVFFEVPTGACADLAGRKKAFLLSCLLRMAAFGMYAFSHRFAAFIAAELVDVLGATLANGALDAWAVDSLHEEVAARPTARFFARAHMVGRTAIMVGGLAGGYLGQRDMTLPWLTAAGSFALTGILAPVLMVETRRAPGSGAISRRSLAHTVREGLIAVHDLPVLRLLCLLTLGLAFAAFPAQHLSWPRLQSLSGQGTWVMGWIWALMNLASLIGSAMLPRLLGRRGRAVVLSVITVWRGLMLTMAAVATALLPTLAGLLLMEVGFGLSEPLLQAWLNEHIAPERRATVLSVRATCMTLGQGTGLLCLGLIARDATIPAAWLTSALILMLIAPVFLLLARRAEAATGNAGAPASVIREMRKGIG